MGADLTPQAISGIDDPDQIRVALFINNQLVHVPIVPAVLASVIADALPGDLDLGGNDIVNAPNVMSNTKETVFTSSGTFTPDPKMIFCEVTAWGGGGAGGGCLATGAGVASQGCGGNGGAYAYARLTAAQIGASKAVTIGAGGTGVSGAAGNAGAATTLGSLISAKGGEGGTISTAASSVIAVPSAVTQSATGDIRGYTIQAPAATIVTQITGTYPISAANSTLGGARLPGNNANGSAAPANTGAGGGGTQNGASQAVRTGGAGGSGLLIIKEYLST